MLTTYDIRWKDICQYITLSASYSLRLGDGTKSERLIQNFAKLGGTSQHISGICLRRHFAVVWLADLLIQKFGRFFSSNNNPSGASYFAFTVCKVVSMYQIIIRCGITNSFAETACRILSTTVNRRSGIYLITAPGGDSVKSSRST